MNLGELIKMLALFPRDTPILNAPKFAMGHQGKTPGLAMQIGTTIFDQNPTALVLDLLSILEGNLGESVATGGNYVVVTESMPVFLTRNLHGAGILLKGLLFTTEGVRFVAEENL